MGVLIEGAWREEELPRELGRAGEFRRADSAFRVAPTLVHDNNVIVESSLILYYVDDAFLDPPLMPKAPVAHHRVHLYNKLIDEYMHSASTIMTFATAFRPRFLKMPREQWLAEINKAPLKRRSLQSQSQA
jgi:glutathione S-transferase